MLGQRRPLGVRVDSQRNIQPLGDKKLQNAKNILARPAPVVLQEKQPVIKPVVKRKTYGGKNCLVSEILASDIDKYLQFVEKKNRLDVNFLESANIDGRMRGILVDWIIQIQAKFNFSPETFYLSCLILDRVVIPLNVTRHNFQLVGLACIFIASKCEEVMIPNSGDFVFMGGDFCSTDNLFEAERNILKAMKFQLSFTYPNHFLRKMRLLMPSEDHAMVYEVSKLLVDISIIEYEFAAWLPSESAAASIHLAYKILQIPCDVELFESVGVSPSSVAEKSKLLAGRLSAYVDEACKLKGLRLKYKDSGALKIVDKHVATINS